MVLLEKRAAVLFAVTSFACCTVYGSQPSKGYIDKDVNFTAIQMQHESVTASTYIDKYNIVALGSSIENTIKLWNVDTTQMVMEFKEHTGTITALTAYCTPEGFVLFSGSEDNTVKIWVCHVNHNRPFKLELKNSYTVRGHNDKITALTLLDSSIMASASQDGCIRIWGMRRLSDIHLRIECYDTIQEDTAVKSMHISRSNNKFLLIDGLITGIISLWDLATKNCIRKIEAHRTPVTTLEYHSLNNCLISTTQDEIKTWDLSSGSLIKSLSKDAKKEQCLDRSYLQGESKIEVTAH